MIRAVCTIFLITTAANMFVVGYSQGCTLKVQENSPLVISSIGFKFMISAGGTIQLDKNKSIKLACPNTGNYIDQYNPHSKVSYAKCIGNNNLRIGSVDETFDNIKCKKRIRGEVQETTEYCGNYQGKFLYIGYNVNGVFITLIKVCYDNDKGNTLYTEHTLYGKEIKNIRKLTTRSDFSTTGLEITIKANEVYRINKQKSIFEKLLGSNEIISSRTYLARGHLSPRVDFIYTIFQDSSYFYLNTAPQWQTINNGNWKSLEEFVRKAAIDYGDNFTVVTGTHGMLSLNDTKNHPTEIFLAGNKLPAPKYIWKIVYNKRTKKGIAFYVINNPFLLKISSNDKLCNNICTNYGWGTNKWDNIANGYIQCCDLTTFTNAVDTAPLYTVSGILRKL